MNNLLPPFGSAWSPSSSGIIPGVTARMPAGDAAQYVRGVQFGALFLDTLETTTLASYLQLTLSAYSPRARKGTLDVYVTQLTVYDASRLEGHRDLTLWLDDRPVVVERWDDVYARLMSAAKELAAKELAAKELAAKELAAKSKEAERQAEPSGLKHDPWIAKAQAIAVARAKDLAAEELEAKLVKTKAMTPAMSRQVGAFLSTEIGSGLYGLGLGTLLTMHPRVAQRPYLAILAQQIRTESMVRIGSTLIDPLFGMFDVIFDNLLQEMGIDVREVPPRELAPATTTSASMPAGEAGTTAEAPKKARTNGASHTAA